MKKLFLVIFIVLARSSWSMEADQQPTQTSKNDLATEDVKPIGCKNFPIPEKNIVGICGQSALFQVVAAGFHATLPHDLAKSLKENPENLLLSVLKRYTLEQRKNDIFIFDSSEINDFWKNDFEKLLLQNDEKAIHLGSINSTTKYPIDFLYENIPVFLETLGSKLVKNMPLVFLTFPVTSNVTTESTRYDDFSKCISRPHIPLGFNIILDGKQQAYELVGVSQIHLYHLEKNSFYALRKLLENIFKHMPSYSIVDAFNRQWAVHVDAYVKYDGTWYVMDDETRWKVTAKNLGPTNSQKSYDFVAHALTQCYPGAPTGLIYAPVKTQHVPVPMAQLDQNISLQTSPQNKNCLIELARDSKKLSRAKSGLVIFTAATLDALPAALITGIVGGTTSFILEKFELSTSYSPALYASGFIGLMTGLISALYHANHIVPNHYSKITYTSEDSMQHLGPREKAI